MSFYDFSVKTIEGVDLKLNNYRGKTLLIVNVASQCGFTPQYEGLEKLYRQYQERGLLVLGFPCNQFGAQEPGTEKEIKLFCTEKYQISFPLFAKINVNGPQADPLFEYLKKANPGILGTEAIKWNFTKFLVDKTGHVVKRFAPVDKPESIEKAICEIL